MQGPVLRRHPMHVADDVVAASRAWLGGLDDVGSVRDGQQRQAHSSAADWWLTV